MQIDLFYRVVFEKLMKYVWFSFEISGFSLDMVASVNLRPLSEMIM